MVDVIIIGAGTAGLSAAIYVQRAGKKALVLEESTYGGQIINTADIENYPGIKHISGFDFATDLYNQAKDLGTTFAFEGVVKIENHEDEKIVYTTKNEYHAKAIIIATGMKRRELGIEREKELTGKGVSYCATCDGMLYKKKDVAVVGGGNTALESITVLSEICNNVYVFVRGDKFRGEQIVVDNILKKDNVHIMYNTSLTEIKGDENFVNEITTTNGNYNVDGVFITIGTNPNSELFKELVSLNNFNEIITNHQTMETSFKNIYAIGDVRDTKIRQILTGMSDAIYAIHDIISNNSKLS